jgi:hypothetical protein
MAIQPLAEAQGMIKTAEGQIMFVTEAPTAVPYAGDGQAPGCQQSPPHKSNRHPANAMAISFPSPQENAP